MCRWGIQTKHWWAEGYQSGTASTGVSYRAIPIFGYLSTLTNLHTNTFGTSRPKQMDCTPDWVAAWVAL